MYNLYKISRGGVVLLIFLGGIATPLPSLPPVHVNDRRHNRQRVTAPRNVLKKMYFSSRRRPCNGNKTKITRRNLNTRLMF